MSNGTEFMVKERFTFLEDKHLMPVQRQLYMEPGMEAQISGKFRKKQRDDQYELVFHVLQHTAVQASLVKRQIFIFLTD